MLSSPQSSNIWAWKIQLKRRHTLEYVNKGNTCPPRVLFKGQATAGLSGESPSYKHHNTHEIELPQNEHASNPHTHTLTCLNHRQKRVWG